MTAAPTNTVASRIIGTLFFGVFLAAGLFFEVMLCRQIWQDAAPYFWTEADAEMIEAHVIDKESEENPFELKVRYRYQVDGKEFVGDQFTRGSKRFKDLGEITKLMQIYAPNARVRCWINPSVPQQAVLDRPALWLGFALLFPLIFIGIGAGGIYAAWTSKPTPDAGTIPISERARKATPTGILRLLGFVFMSVGAIVTYMTLVAPGLKILDARDWRPTECVLVRGWTPGMWLGLIPLCFFAVGCWLLRRQSGKPNGNDQMVLHEAQGGSRTAQIQHGGPVQLKVASSPVIKLIGVTFAALFWCGITSVFVTMAAKAWLSGRPEWFLMIFLIPFVLIGFGLLVAVPYQLLACFSPRLTLTLNTPAAVLGGQMRLDWRFNGNTRRIRRFRLLLEAREEATYARGTDTTTDRRVFLELTLIDSTNPQDFTTGSTEVTIPNNLVPTFMAKNNKIIWALRGKGDIPRWPDIDDEFQLTVLPGRI